MKEDETLFSDLNYENYKLNDINYVLPNFLRQSLHCRWREKTLERKNGS